MAARVHDCWIWLGFGVFFVLAAKGIQYAIQDTVRLTALDLDKTSLKDGNNRPPEDSISLDTLRALASSPNANIANAAISLIVSRFTQKPGAIQALRRDMCSSNEDMKRAACQTSRFLRGWNGDFLLDSPIPTPPRMPAVLAELDFAINAHRSSDMLESQSSSLVSRLEELQMSMDFPGNSGTNSLASSEAFPIQRPPALYSPEEAARRRNRREAMVLHEGQGRLRENDIYRPVSHI